MKMNGNGEWLPQLQPGRHPEALLPPAGGAEAVLRASQGNSCPPGHSWPGARACSQPSLVRILVPVQQRTCQCWAGTLGEAPWTQWCAACGVHTWCFP